MLSGSEGDDHVAFVEMNSELRHAQVELLSAECAMDRIRLRFSLDDVVRFGDPEVLRRAVASATALQEYFSNLTRPISGPDTMAPPRASSFQEKIKVVAAIERLRQYFRVFAKRRD